MSMANDATESAATSSTTMGAHRQSDVVMTSLKRFAWLRQWEFWLALAIAAFLRLWRIDLTQFLDDQTGIAGIARTGLLTGALPLTSNLSSIGTFHSPLTEYLLMPFLAFGKNPLPAVVSIAIWNVLGIAFCYIFALRYFGRRAALAASLLFATCGTAINYSRFIWQPNYLPPILGLWALAIFAGCAGSRRNWFVPAAALTVLAMLFHETAAILLVVLAVAVVLAPRRPRRGEWIAAGALAVVLFLPFMVFQAISRGYDLRALAHYLKAPGHFDLEMLRALSGALGGMGSGDFGTQSPLFTFRGIYPILDALALVFFACGYLLLTARVLAPARALSLDTPAAATTGRERLTAWLGAGWRALRSDPVWRVNLLLWVWVTVPLLATLHHSSPVTVHYLLPLYPAFFVVAGLPVQWLWDLRRAVERLPLATWARAASLAALALLALLTVGQSARWLLYPSSLASGQFMAYTFYGYPLSELQHADTALTTLQARQHAHGVFVITPETPRYAAPMNYLLASEQAGHVAFTDTCLLLPAPAAGPALVVATDPATQPAQLLAALSNAQPVAQIPVAGGPPFAVYRVTGTIPMQSGELPVVPASFVDSSGNGLRLDAAASVAPGLIRLRWTVLGSETTSVEQPWYRVSATQGAASGKTDCQPTRWQAGETLFTWVRVSPPPNGAGVAPAAGPLTITVAAGTIGPDMPGVGLFRFITGRPGGTPLAPLPLTQPSGARAPHGSYVLPITG